MRRIRAHAHAVAAPHAPPLEVSPPIVRKVPGETAFLHHLIVSVPSSLLHLPHSKASRLPLHSFERSRAFPQFVRSFRRCAVFRVFCSPSEGAQSPGTLCRACTRVFVSSRLLPPSEGVQFSRVFCSPSEGAQSPGTLCRACTRVFVSSRLLPPSKGVQFSRVFCSPSEGAQSHGALCSACIRVSVSSRLFPPSEGGPNPAVSVSPLEGEHVYLFRNGSRFRISLPLWKRAGEAILSREPVAMV